jgi:RNA polymerase sigma factor (TIGR02999 family)
MSDTAGLPVTDKRSVTALLKAWRSGDQDALDRLMPLVYGELYRLAQGYMRGERPDHTLQPTALVNEAFLRFVDADVDWKDRAHFFAVAATTMRRILVDHARAHGRKKRAGVKVSLEDAVLVAPDREAELVAVDDALTRLARHDERAAKTVELHYFGGLTYDEIAQALGVSAATVERDLRFAKAWMYREINEGEGRESPDPGAGSPGGPASPE